MNKPFNPIALHRLLKHASKAEILKIPQQRVDLQQIYENGDTVYHVVLRNKVLKEEEITAILQMFLDRGVNSATLNDYSKAPLHLAIEYRMKHVINFLIQHSPQLLDSPYMLTRFFIEDEKVKFWCGAKRNCGDLKSWNSKKIESTSADFFEWLILKEFDSDSEINQERLLDLLKSSIVYNLQHVTLAFLRLVPGKLIDTSHPGFSNLFREFFERIVRARIHHNKLSSKAWYSRYSSRYASKIVKIFLEINGAIVGYNWLGELQCAIRQEEEIGVIKLLVDNYFSDNLIDPDFAKTLLNTMLEHPYTFLSDSEFRCYKQVLNDLASVDAEETCDDMRCMNGKSSVQLAVKAENIHAAAFLKDIGADFDVKDYQNRSLLHLLAENQSANQKMCEWLVNEGLDVNARDDSQRTTLHLAAKLENVALARKLIELGAGVDCRDDLLQTPLHHAVINNESIQLAKVLLQNGADIEAKDKDDESPLILSIFPPHYGKVKFQMVRLLLNWGAQMDALYVTECTRYNWYSWDSRYSRDYRKEFQYIRHDVKTLLNQHCLKLIAAGLLVTENCESHLEVTSDHGFYQECLKELETLKSTFINSCTSLYHFLHVNLDRKSFYARNEGLKKLVHPAIIEKRFPLYSNVILAGYRAGQIINCLLERAKVAWLVLTEIYLPNICIERILFYMSNEELKVIVRPLKGRNCNV